jgi:hypothetical protein
MPIITIYRCDKCGDEHKDPSDMWEVTIWKRPMRSPLPAWQSRIEVGSEHPATFCRGCAVLLRIIEDKKVPEDDLPPEPSIEDLIVEIIDQRIQEKTGAT